ncbi:MAG TPA: MarR family transcriptional regulator [Anaerolineaceae bacterium]|nr:MarR family transcriptional regulator [Anaerolineaceae bacterium]
MADSLFDTFEKWASLVMRRSSHEMSRFSRSQDLSIGQLNVLLWLYNHGPREVSAIYDQAHGSPAAASQMVERLVQEGLVERSESPTDRRVRLVSLTARGKTLAEQSLEARLGWLRDRMDSLAPAQRHQLEEAFKILLTVSTED